MKEGLCHDLGLKPFTGGRKIAVIDDAEYMNDESANCLLKTLEEPPPGALIVLLATSEDRVLPTVRSRCQLIRFRPLAVDQIAALLVQKGIMPSDDEARRIAAQSEGSMREALELAAPELWAFRAELLARLAEPVLPSVDLARLAGAFIDQAGREAVMRRERARKVVRFVLQYYRQLVRGLSGLSPGGDSELARAIESACRVCPFGVETAVTCAERCLDALDDIDRFAHQAAWLECWLYDLGRISQRDQHISA
jgi:DNA polymerase-3 subunit delta'